MLRIGCEGVDWIQLAQHKIHWRVLVNTVMKLMDPIKSGEFPQQLRY